MTVESLKEKKVAIVGLGIEGLSTAEYLLNHNVSFTVYDEKSEEKLFSLGQKEKGMIEKLKRSNIPLYLGQSLSSELFQNIDVIFRSPGISLKADFFKEFTGEMTSHTKLFFDICPAQIIGVTGTKGKGTTSSLIYEMLKIEGRDAYLGGNIGLPPLSFVDSLTKDSVVVLELSSFQLEDLQKSPHISVMLMVTQEHLDSYGNQNYHESIDAYVAAKQNIVAWQHVDDMAVLNIDYPATRTSGQKTPAKLGWVSRYQEVENGCLIRDNKVILRENGEDTDIIDVAEILLPGAHNLENVCAAVMAAYFAGVDTGNIARVLKTFKGLEHRLELVREVDGVRYYDDSFSTTPETAIAAINAFDTPEILILGGSSKKSDFRELGKLLSQSGNIKIVIGIGMEWERIKKHIVNPHFEIVEGLKTMKEIITVCHANAKSGDVVLLSPACASFDMFANYKERGNQFKKEVDLL